jgi:hypothetical protein
VALIKDREREDGRRAFEGDRVAVPRMDEVPRENAEGGQGPDVIQRNPVLSG